MYAVGAAFGVGNQHGLQFGDLATGVTGSSGAFDAVAGFQAHLVAGRHGAIR